MAKARRHGSRVLRVVRCIAITDWAAARRKRKEPGVGWQPHLIFDSAWPDGCEALAPVQSAIARACISIRTAGSYR